MMRMTDLIHNTKFLVSVSSACSLAVGVTAGVLGVRKHLEQKYADLATQEIEQAREYYSVRVKADYPTPADAVKKLLKDEPGHTAEAINEVVEVLESYSPTRTDYAGVEPAEEPEEKPTVEIVNVFVENRPLEDVDVDWEAETLSRSTDAPYIVTYDEYMRNEPEHEQTVLTYFEDDDILADDKDNVVDEHHTCGAGNLRFGVASKDNNVVYIRNHQLGVDFEVVRAKGSYAQTVGGFIQHSEPRIRRFRQGDDE